MPTMQEIALDIVQRAKARGVNPNFALGIAGREGLTPGTINSPTFGNRDVHGYSYGPWQLYSGSPTPGAVVGGGQASQFLHRYGVAPSAANWREQNQFAIDLLARLNPQQQAATWHAIGDNGGHAAIANIGARLAAQYGLTGAVGNPSALPPVPGGGAPVAPGQPAPAGGDYNFELGPAPNDSLPEPDNAMASYGGGEGGASDPTDLSDLNAGYGYGGDMGAPLDDGVSAKYAAVEQQRRMGVRGEPTDMNLANLFQDQNINLQKIGSAKDMPALRKMSVG